MRDVASANAGSGSIGSGITRCRNAAKFRRPASVQAASLLAPPGCSNLMFEPATPAWKP